MLDIRQRTGYLFLAVMLGHIILISAQVNTRSGVRVLEAVTFGVFSEVQRGSSHGVQGVRGLWDGYVGLRGVRQENEALRRQLGELQIRLQQERAVAGRSRQLERLLELREQAQLSTTAARVIATDATSFFRTFTIDKGTADGLRSDMAVIAPAGVVGRIVGGLAPRAAKVQLLIDRSAAAGAVIERSRAAGVVVGSGDALSGLRMEYVSNLADVKTGDAVVTSGIDRVYPRGFMLGRVEVVERGAGQYKTITVRPAVDFSGVEEILVVLSPPLAPDREAGE